MPNYTFSKVTFQATKRGICPVCGKAATRSTTFWQTINPFNKDAFGVPKTADQIRIELKAEAEAWTPDFTHSNHKETA